MKKKDSRIYVRLSQEDKKILKNITQEKNISMSDFVRNIIRKEIKKEQKKNKK